MSRIGKLIINIPEKVSIRILNDVIFVEGPKGKLQEKLCSGLKIVVEDKILKVERLSEEKKVVAMHGMMRALVANMVKGASVGFEKNLEIVGVGYKAQLKGKDLELNLGYSHSIVIKALEDVKFEVDGNVRIKISGPHRYRVGQIASDIRNLKLPEPYKGKGVRYFGEHIRRKAGKSAVSSAG